MTGGNGYHKTKELEGFLQDEKDVATHVGTIVIHTSERASQLLLLDGVMEEVEKSVTTINMVREGAAPFFKPSRANLPLQTSGDRSCEKVHPHCFFGEHKCYHVHDTLFVRNNSNWKFVFDRTRLFSIDTKW